MDVGMAVINRLRALEFASLFWGGQGGIVDCCFFHKTTHETNLVSGGVQDSCLQMLVYCMTFSTLSNLASGVGLQCMACPQVSSGYSIEWLPLVGVFSSHDGARTLPAYFPN